MKSPFPGMDPYLEAHWRDVHTRLQTYICDALQEQLPRELVARVEEEVAIDADRPVGPGNRMRPDVSVAEDWQIAQAAGSAAGPATMAAAEPLVFQRQEDVQRHVEILDAEGGRVITAIEVLSPSNRTRGAGREAYLAKRRRYVEGGVNIVEVDLVRAGEHTVGVEPDEIPPARRATYYACAWRSAFRRWELYPLPLREKLPGIRVPLRVDDPDAVLDLQPLIDEVYRRGRYNHLRYTASLVPSFSDADAEWVRATLRAAGREPK